TRKNTEGLFNIRSENNYSDYSPAGVQWYNGPTHDAGMSDYDLGLRNVFGSLGSLPGNTLSMYIPETGNYYDVEFLTWTSVGNGGGYSYSRTQTVNWLVLSHYDNMVPAMDNDTVYIL